MHFILLQNFPNSDFTQFYSDLEKSSLGVIISQMNVKLNRSMLLLQGKLGELKSTSNFASERISCFEG